MSNEIEIDHRYYCAEQGMFCQFMDRRSGYCIATSCKRATDLIMQAEIDRQAKIDQEIKNGRFEMQEELFEKAMDQIMRYGATTVGLDIDEDDLDYLK